MRTGSRIWQLPTVEKRAGERRVVASDRPPPTNARSAGVFSAYGKVVGFGPWYGQGGRNLANTKKTKAFYRPPHGWSRQYIGAKGGISA